MFTQLDWRSNDDYTAAMGNARVSNLDGFLGSVDMIMSYGMAGRSRTC